MTASNSTAPCLGGHLSPSCRLCDKAARCMSSYELSSHIRHRSRILFSRLD